MPINKKNSHLNDSRSSASRQRKKAPAGAPAAKTTAVTAAPLITLRAEIAPTSIASAARAYQLMVSLRTLGEIVSMTPDPAQIDAGLPTRQFTAQLSTRKSPEEIRQALDWISEVDRLDIDGEAGNPAEVVVSMPKKIAFFVSDLSNVIHQAQFNEAKKYALEKYGVEVFVFDGKADAAVMTANLDRMMAQGMDAATLQVWDAEAAKPRVLAALQKGLIMTAFFSPLADTGIPVARNDEASISFAMGAEMAAHWQSAHPGRPIVMAEVGWPNHTEVKSGRTDPWVKGVRSVDPKAQDLGCLDASAGTDAAKQVMQGLLAQHPEVNLIYSEAANLTVGTMAALAQVGRGKFNNGQPLTEIVASVDFDEAEMRSVYDPNSSLKLSMGLPPVETARGRIDLIMDIAADKVAPTSQPAQEFFYQAHNISFWTTQAEVAREHSQTHLDDKTVRTSVERLDSLMSLVGELITDRNRLHKFRGDFESRFRGDAQADTLADIAAHLGHTTDQLQEEVVRIRMLPLATVFNKFPRVVRDLAQKSDKQVELVIQGEDTELDRSVIEEISEPLLHLLRNAIDHGLEPPAQRRAAGKPERGTVLLTARQDGNRILITVEDDGRGIDTDAVRASAVRQGLLSAAEAAALTEDEAIQLIFRPKLSTAKEIGDSSGDGMGMDVVRASIERLNGTLTVNTQPGRGTQFWLAFPLTLAIVPALLVDAGANTFALPLANVVEAHRIPISAIHTVNGRLVIQLRGQVLPLVRLSQVLGAAQAADPAVPAHAREFMVSVRWGKTEMGLIVEKLVGKQDLVIKSLGALGDEILGVSGAAILGDGRVALIVDVPSLFKYQA